MRHRPMFKSINSLKVAYTKTYSKLLRSIDRVITRRYLKCRHAEESCVQCDICDLKLNNNMHFDVVVERNCVCPLIDIYAV